MTPPLPDPEKRIPALLNALSGVWKQLTAIGVFVLVALVVAYFLIERRLTGDAPPSAITRSLPIAMDVLLWVLAVVGIMVALLWLLVVIHRLYRQWRANP